MKLAKFKGRYYFIPDFGTFIVPNGDPEDVLSIDHFSKEDKEKAKKTPNDNKLLAKGKKINLP